MTNQDLPFLVRRIFFIIVYIYIQICIIIWYILFYYNHIILCYIIWYIIHICRVPAWILRTLSSKFVRSQLGLFVAGAHIMFIGFPLVFVPGFFDGFWTLTKQLLEKLRIFHEIFHGMIKNVYFSMWFNVVSWWIHGFQWDFSWDSMTFLWHLYWGYCQFKAAAKRASGKVVGWNPGGTCTLWHIAYNSLI